MPQPKFLLGYADSALTDISWLPKRQGIRTNRISESELEPLIRLAFLLLPKMVIQDSSVANNAVFANLYAKHGASFLSALRSSTEIVTSHRQKSFADLLGILRERQAYGVPREGEEALRHERWISALDQHGVSKSFRSYDLSQLSMRVQSHVFSPDRLEQVRLGRMAAKVSALERSCGPLAGHGNRTWYFELADELAKTDRGLAEDIRWMATGSLFLTISNAAGAELVLPNMKTKLLKSSSHVIDAEVSRTRSLFEDTPLIHSRWLDDGFPALSFEAIARLRKSDEFKLFANDLGSVKDLPIHEGRAKLQSALNNYLSAIAYEIGKTYTQPKRVTQERRITSLASASRWGGYAATPIGGVTSALTLISPSLTFTPVLGVVLSAVGMIFTGNILSRKAADIHEKITHAGMETNLVAPTPVSVADLVALL